jgi:purine catabolism regulator
MRRAVAGRDHPCGGVHVWPVAERVQAGWSVWYDSDMVSASAAPAADARRHAITVKDALRLAELRVGVPEVIAGRENLGRTIRWVHAGEFTEMATVLKGGELLLTTGMGVPREERAARRWIADLAARGIAGLVIELGSALATIPQAILSEARRLRLPMIALHQQVAFVDVTEVLHREILGHDAAVRDRGQATYRRLSALMLDGARTPQIVEALAELVGQPVILARAGAGILLQANLDRRGIDVASAWESMRRRLDAMPRAASLPVSFGHDPQWGELAVVPFDDDLSPLDLAALEHAVTFVGIALMRDREVWALASRGRGEFLATLMQGQGLSELQAQARAASLGFDHRSMALLPLVVTYGCEGEALAEDQWVRVAESVTMRVQAAGRQVIAGVQPSTDGGFLVVGLRDESERATVAAETAAAVHASAEEHLLPDGALHVSVGRAASSWRALGASLRDAATSAEAAVHRPPAAWYDVACPDVAELLWLFRGSSALRRLVEERIEPLVEHDRRHNSSLVQTLETLYAHGGRKAEAARALYLERQSLYKRIARIESLLGVDLDDEDTRLAVQLALRARPLVHATESR